MNYKSLYNFKIEINHKITYIDTLKQKIWNYQKEQEMHR